MGPVFWFCLLKNYCNIWLKLFTINAWNLLQYFSDLIAGLTRLYIKYFLLSWCSYYCHDDCEGMSSGYDTVWPGRNIPTSQRNILLTLLEYRMETIGSPETSLYRTIIHSTRHSLYKRYSAMSRWPTRCTILLIIFYFTVSSCYTCFERI